MPISRLHKLLTSGLAGVMFAAGGLAAATHAGAAEQGVRVRGAVVSLSGDQLQVKSRDGQPVTVKLADGWMVSAVKKLNELHFP